MINHSVKSQQREIEEQEVADAVSQYFKNGGKITKCQPFARTENLTVGQWGRKNAKKKVENPTE